MPRNGAQGKGGTVVDAGLDQPSIAQRKGRSSSVRSSSGRKAGYICQASALLGDYSGYGFSSKIFPLKYSLVLSLIR